MIVKIGNWANNTAVGALCDGLLAVPGASKKATPQRCMIRSGGETCASIGIESGVPVVEFLPTKEDYALAHGARFVKPHPLPQMARDGWLQARTGDAADLERIRLWIVASIERRSASHA